MQLGEHEAIVGKNDYFRVDPRKLKIMPGFNLRDMNAADTLEHIADLKEQIRGTGVLDPLEIRLVQDDICVTHGHCRLTAVMELIAEGEEIKSVPAVAEPKGINDAERTLRQRISNTGSGLNPLALAEMVRRLRAYGWEDQQIAVRNGWTVQTVQNYVALLAMPAETQQMVKANGVSASLALEVTKKNGHKAAGEVLRKAMTVAKEAGKEKVTAKSVRAVEGGSHLKPAQLKELIATIRAIALNDDEPRSSNAAAAVINKLNIGWR